MLDLPLPGNDVLAEVQDLVRNLIDMSEILRDRSRSSIRLVMNPERMVIKEAQRTFTYLNLYGYLTDAVVVNRVFPDDVEGGYFAAWREVQREHMEFVEQAFAPGPGAARARSSSRRWSGPRCWSASARRCSARAPRERVLYHDLSQELMMDGDSAELRLRVPFVEKGDMELKKIGLELVDRVGGRKRNIVLPSALASFRPREAKLEAGTLRVQVRAPGRRLHGQAGEWTRGTGVRTRRLSEVPPPGEDPPLAGRPAAAAARRARGSRAPVRGVLPDLPHGGRAARRAAAGVPGALAGAPARGAAGRARADRPLPPPPGVQRRARAPVEDIPIE